MAYCVMHIEKRKAKGVRGLQIEANRTPESRYTFDRSDIDSSRTEQNVFFRRCANWEREIERQTQDAGVKPRKDSVVMLTTIYSASPDWFATHSKEEMMSYFGKCLEFHDKTYGYAFNAVLHLDETSPHLHVASVPIVYDEKGAHLSAKILLGGRMDYRAKQDAFYEEVGRAYGLERGVPMTPGEQKRRMETRDWKIKQQEQQLAEVGENLELKKIELKDITTKIQDGIDTQVRALKAGFNLERDKVKVYRTQYEYLVDFANSLKRYLDGLTTTSMMTREAYEEVKAIRSALDTQIESEVERRVSEIEKKMADDITVAEARRERYEHLCDHQEEVIEREVQKQSLRRAERVLKGVGEDISKINRMESYMRSAGVWDDFADREKQLLERTISRGRSR